MKSSHNIMFFIFEIFVIVKQSLIIKKWTACMETTVVRLSVLLLAYKPCQIFMKFGAGHLHKKLLRKSEFCYIRHIDVHNLCKNLNNILSAFYTFLGRFGRNLVRKTCM